MKIKEDVIIMVMEKVRKTMNLNIGGPFGAAILDKDGEVLAISSNSVLGDKDPTAHAEMNAIREACEKVGSHDLSGCILYTTCYPCPMCLGAIIWSNIKEVYYSCEPEDADKIGFRDDYIYDFIKYDMKNEEVLKLVPENRKLCLELFKEYLDDGRQIY